MSQFQNANAYERYMSGWSRAAGTQFLDWLALPPGLRWLDVGCGSGAFTALLAERAAPAELHGLDRSPDMLAYAQSRLPAHVQLHTGDATALPFPAACFDAAVMPLADYVAVNISSPNTANLRKLQGGNELDELLGALDRERQRLATSVGRNPPLLLKIAPDLDDDQIAVIIEALVRHNIDGVIATNTTLSREAVKGLPHAEETGGLSGRPVFEASNRVIRALRAGLPARYPIIGVGGVMSAQDAVAKIEAGADLVQIFSGLVYEGPALVSAAARAIHRHDETIR